MYFAATPDEKRAFTALKMHHARGALLMRNFVGPEEQNARILAKELHLDWGHASASRLKRILADVGNGSNAILTVARKVDECDGCMACLAITYRLRAPHEAHHLRRGTSPAVCGRLLSRRWLIFRL